MADRLQQVAATGITFADIDACNMIYSDFEKYLATKKINVNKLLPFKPLGDYNRSNMSSLCPINQYGEVLRELYEETKITEDFILNTKSASEPVATYKFANHGYNKVIYLYSLALSNEAKQVISNGDDFSAKGVFDFRTLGCNAGKLLFQQASFLSMQNPIYASDETRRYQMSESNALMANCIFAKNSQKALLDSHELVTRMLAMSHM